MQVRSGRLDVFVRRKLSNSAKRGRMAKLDGIEKKTPSVQDAAGTSSDASFLLAQNRQQSRMETLSRIIRSRPPLDRHPPERIGNFLPEWFDRNVEKPGVLLTDIVELCKAELPRQLYDAVALAGIHRGSLTIYVQSAAAKAEIDSCLRSSLVSKIQTRTHGVVQKVRTVVNRSMASNDFSKSATKRNSAER